jgi:hypothetical protein
MMHNDVELFADSEDMIYFCKLNKLRYVAKPLDNVETNWMYNRDQFNKLKTVWTSLVPVAQQLNYTAKIDLIGKNDTVSSIQEGRPCCGGRKLSLNGDLKSNVNFVPRQGFEGWSCSVNWFFLFVRQLDGAVYTNKDCKTSTTGLIEPLGYLSHSADIVNTLKTQLETNSMPVIQCVKLTCLCGFCAPKAESRKDFMELIQRNVPVDVFQK